MHGRAGAKRWWVAAAVAIVLAACSEDSAGLADTCEMPPGVVTVITGMQVGAGQKTEPYDGASECRYTAGNGQYVLVKVDGDESAFSEQGGRAIGGVGEEAKIQGDTLYARSEGDTWTFQVAGTGAEPNSLEVALVALANEVLPGGG